MGAQQRYYVGSGRASLGRRVAGVVEGLLVVAALVASLVCNAGGRPRHRLVGGG